MKSGNIEVELMKYGDIVKWTPKLGDVIFKDGLFTRWFAVIYGINNDILLIKKSGNLRLLIQGDYEESQINFRKIKNSMIGSYSIISSEGVYYL